MIALIVVSWAIALVLLLPTVADLASLFTLTLRRPKPAAPNRPPRLLFLIPAHDEQLLITSCVRSVRALRYPSSGRAIVVVADNCTDRTAELAEAAGALVLERDVKDQPGKPHAIAWALGRLPLERYEAVVIVDADCTLDVEFANGLAAQGPLAGKVVQPYNDVRNPGETALTRLAALFAAARYRLSYRLKSATELSVPLSAGMCIGTRVLKEHGWTAYSICEDWEYYATSTELGVPVRLAAGARITAMEESEMRRSTTQRRRWFAGKLSVAGLTVPRLIASHRIGWRQKLDAVGELLAPGPVLHAAIVLPLAAALVLVPWATAQVAALGLVASLVRPAAYSLAALWFIPRPWATIRAFAMLPPYAVWRVVTALGSLGAMAHGPWVRTARQG